MGKKKTVNLNGEPLRDTPFTEGVQITYKNNTIAQSAISVEYTLETGCKAVEADIGVGYIKPVQPIIGVPVTISCTASTTPTAYTTGCALENNGNEIIVYARMDTRKPVTSFNGKMLAIVPVVNSTNKEVVFNINSINSGTDVYDVTLNGNTVTFNNDRGYYRCRIEKELITASDVMNITIADKTTAK